MNVVTAGPVPAVAMRSITKRFPGVLANDSVDFEAQKGEVHALLGENGAGKSTLASILTGLYRPDAGEIAIDGRTVEFRSPKDAREAGVSMVHQHFRLAASLTVSDNIVLGQHDAGWLRTSPRIIDSKVEELAKRYRMPVDPRARIWQLSVGEQQRVEILKALYRGARILILDEPTSLLTPQEADDLFETLRRMTAEGRTVIFVSHKLDELMAVADRVTVLRGGRSIGTVLTRETSPSQLARMMVGREVVFAQTKQIHDLAGAAVVLELRGVSAAGDLGIHALDGVSFSVRAGEIVGVAGVSGNGQRQLAEVISGARPRTAGDVLLAGSRLRSGDPEDAILKGIAHVPEDRMHTGVSPSLSIADNLILKSHRRPPISFQGILRHGSIRTNARDMIARFSVAAPGPDTPTRLLSGGNVQKVVLARELSSRPVVIVAANPTRGLDVGATEGVRALLIEAASKGVGILLISEDLDEILLLADRIAVIYNGRIVGLVPRAEADIQQIGLMMAGSSG
ncbi:MAG TPA: ABC transporter ATP-binding protein [Candidatus Limnocylindria bacterium]|nr:ABC transporter ATP-binding protein [Candidatus Limnocylindria bacterium]